MPSATIYFISDTHLGDGTAADPLRYPEALLELLARIESDPGAHLVLLGDVLELWACSLEPVLIRHAPVIQAIARLAASHPVTYVVGNHDCLPWYYYLGHVLENVGITERFTAGRGALVALHGHQFDPVNRVTVTSDGHVKAPLVRKLVQWLGAFERVGGTPARQAIDELYEAGGSLVTALDQFIGRLSKLAEALPTAIDRPFREAVSLALRQAQAILQQESPGERGYPAAERNYEEGARRLLRAGAQFVVMGHTHHPLVHRYGHRVYVNTGSWVWDRYPPTYARFQDGRLELLRADTHQPYLPE